MLLDHYLREAIGKPGSASLKRARELAADGVFDPLVAELSAFGFVGIGTDEEVDVSCLYVLELEPNSSVKVWISTILPYGCVAIYANGFFDRITDLSGEMGSLGRLRKVLESNAIFLLSEELCRAKSAYVDAATGEREPYFSVMFEFEVDPPWDAG